MENETSPSMINDDSDKKIQPKQELIDESSEKINYNISDESQESLFEFSINDLSKEEHRILNNIIHNKQEELSSEHKELIISIEESLSLYHINRSNLDDLCNRENYIKNINLKCILSSNSANFLNISSDNDFLFNLENEYDTHDLLAVRDKVNKAFNEFILPPQPNEIFSSHMNNQQVNTEEIWPIFKEFLKDSASKFMPFIKELPGFHACHDNLNVLVNENLSVLFRFKMAKLFKDNEFHFVLNNTPINRNLANQFFGSKICDCVYEFHELLNSLNLTNFEMALLIPFFLTISGILAFNLLWLFLLYFLYDNLFSEVELFDNNYLKELNMIYGRVLLHEFSLNNRDVVFMNKLIQVILFYLFFFSKWVIFSIVCYVIK